MDINSNSIQSTPLKAKFSDMNGVNIGNSVFPTRKISNEICENTAAIAIAPNLKSFLSNIIIIIPTAIKPNVME